MKKIILLVLISMFAGINSSYCLEDKVVAIVNNEVITKAELDMYINLLKIQLREESWQEQGISERSALESLIEDRLVTQEAKNKKIEISQRLIESRVERIRSGFRSDDEFYEFLMIQGLSITELEKRIKEQMLSDKLITMQIRNRIIISPAEVTEYYQSNIKDFYLPNRVQVESIFVQSKDLSKEIYDKLESGVDFIELQKQYSKGSSLGLVNRGQLRKDIEDVIFNLEIEKFSKPLEISGGYYIFLVREKLPASEKDLVEVQDEIYNIISEMKFNKKLKEWIGKLKENSYIVIKVE